MITVDIVNRCLLLQHNEGDPIIYLHILDKWKMKVKFQYFWIYDVTMYRSSSTLLPCGLLYYFGFLFRY